MKKRQRTKRKGGNLEGIERRLSIYEVSTYIFYLRNQLIISVYLIRLFQ